LKGALEALSKDLKPEQIAKANDAAEQAKKDREAKKAAAASAAAGSQPSPAAAATSASPEPATPGATDGKKPTGGFRIPSAGGNR
jgi:hypothetical protein